MWLYKHTYVSFMTRKPLCHAETNKQTTGNKDRWWYNVAYEKTKAYISKQMLKLNKKHYNSTKVSIWMQKLLHHIQYPEEKKIPTILRRKMMKSALAHHLHSVQLLEPHKIQKYLNPFV